VPSRARADSAGPAGHETKYKHALIKMIKSEVKTEPRGDAFAVKNEVESDDDEYIVPQKRLRRNQGD